MSFLSASKSLTAEDDSDSTPQEYKIAVMGSGGVGKSALILRLVTGKVPDEYDPTIEDSYRKQEDIDGSPAMMDLLDTAGQEEFSSMWDAWIRGSKAFLLMYSITNESTLKRIHILYEKILNIKDPKENDQIIMVVVGNKCDLVTERQVKKEEGQKIVNKFNKNPNVKSAFFETSATDNSAFSEECFKEIVRLLRNNKKKSTKKKEKKSIFKNLLKSKNKDDKKSKTSEKSKTTEKSKTNVKSKTIEKMEDTKKEETKKEEKIDDKFVKITKEEYNELKEYKVKYQNIVKKINEINVIVNKS